MNTEDKPSLTVTRVFTLVSAGALIGMLLGGTFGYVAGRIAPDLFKHLLVWGELEPVGTATVFGATGGVVCGGCLMAFGILAQLLALFAARK